MATEPAELGPDQDQNDQGEQAVQQRFEQTHAGSRKELGKGQGAPVQRLPPSKLPNTPRTIWRPMPLATLRAAVLAMVCTSPSY